MKKQVSRFSLHQTSKVIALIYFFIALIVSVIYGIIALIGGHFLEGIAAFIIPFFYGIITYIFTLIGLWFYNLIADSFGGIEFNLVDVEEKKD